MKIHNYLSSTLSNRTEVPGKTVRNLPLQDLSHDTVSFSGAGSQIIKPEEITQLITNASFGRLKYLLENNRITKNDIKKEYYRIKNTLKQESQKSVESIINSSKKVN